MVELKEAALVLLEALVRKDGDGEREGMFIAVAPGSRNLVVQVALTQERFATFSWERPCSFQIPPDNALRLAHDLLRVYAPGAADLLERAVARAELQLVAGGAGGPEAA